MQVRAPDSVSAQVMPRPLPSVQPWGNSCARALQSAKAASLPR
ncbi:hypothetical protein [Ruminococcus callidus]